VPCLINGRYYLPYPGFDASAETFYESRTSMNETFQSRPPGYQDHTSRLLDVSRYSWLVGRQQVLIDGEPPDGFVKLMTFMRMHPLSSIAELSDSLNRQASVVADTQPVRHVHVVRDDEPDSSTGFDAVDLTWFPTPEGAVEYVQSEAGYEAQAILRGSVLGVERVVVHPEVYVAPPSD
jgi:hypothetical protein